MYTYQELREIVDINRRNRKRIKETLKIYKVYPIFSIFLSIMICTGIIGCLIYAIAEYNIYDLSNKNQIGDAFGGIANPIIAFFGVFVTFLAFYIQYRFNREQSKLIAQQRAERKEDKIQGTKELFDRKFFELLKIHNENVKEFNIDNKYFGRECFPQILNELKLIYQVLDSNFIFKDLNETTLRSYVVLFYGIDSKNVQRQFDQNPEIIKKLKDFIKDYKDFKKFVLETSKDSFKLKYKLDEVIIINHELFRGHQFRLNHYFRHLFFILESIENSEFLNDNEKQEYFNIVRAQLSNYEQSLLYYNSTCLYAEKYKKYIVEYSIIKNITLEICDFGIQPNEFYKEEISLKRLGKLSFLVSSNKYYKIFKYTILKELTKKILINQNNFYVI